MKKLRFVTVRLTDDDYAELEKLAVEEDRSISSIFRRVLHQFLSRPRKTTNAHKGYVERRKQKS